VRHIYFHVDLDAFFASVEQRDHPEFKGKPVIVGAAPGHRGVVSTCSYEARALGLHSAMPISEAYRRCPQGIYLPVRMHRYGEVSRRIMSILAEYTPDTMQLSIDEAMLDMTGTRRLWGERTGVRLIKKHTRCHGTHRFHRGERQPICGEIASDSTSPMASSSSTRERSANSCVHCPGEIVGAGGKTREALRKIGVATMAELQALPLSILESKFGKAGGAFLRAAALGEDPGIFSGETKSQSMSGERTFERDTTDREAVRDVLRIIADELAARMCDECFWSCTIGSSYLRRFLINFEAVHEGRTLRGADEIYEDAVLLLDRNGMEKNPIRLVGASLQNLRKGACVQGHLFENGKEKSEEVRRAVQELDKRGTGRLVRAKYIKPQDKGETGEKR